MKQLEMLYEGKAKQVFLTDDPEMIVIHYKDDATAFNNIKKARIENKGVLNNRISTLIFEYLRDKGIETHYVETINDRDQVCRKVSIVPLEVIVRNIIAGSMASVWASRRVPSRRTSFTTSATRKTSWAIL